MISLEESIPSLSDTYLLGQDIFFTQFNEINFYVEDKDQENFYFLILKNLFNNIRIEKIFPLNGKPNVIEEAKLYNSDKKKIFIVDKDFDNFLDKKIEISNLFYLNRYSIENYFLNFSSIREYIIEEKPRTKISSIQMQFDINTFKNNCVLLFKELSAMHLLAQKICPHIPNVDQSLEIFCSFNPAGKKSSALDNYKSKLIDELYNKDRRLKYERQLKIASKQIGTTIEEVLNNIPGKYLIKYLKYHIEHIFSIASRSTESFLYRLAKNSSFSDLDFLKVSVQDYLDS